MWNSSNKWINTFRSLDLKTVQLKTCQTSILKRHQHTWARNRFKFLLCMVPHTYILFTLSLEVSSRSKVKPSKTSPKSCLSSLHIALKSCRFCSTPKTPKLTSSTCWSITCFVIKKPKQVFMKTGLPKCITNTLRCSLQLLHWCHRLQKTWASCR